MFSAINKFRGITPYSSPYFTAAMTTTTYDWKVSLQYGEFIWLHNPTYRPAMERVISYFMTDIALDDVSGDGSFGDDEKEKYSSILREQLDIMHVLKQVNISKYCYGNAFVSVLPYVVRFLSCPKCFSSWKISSVITEPVFKFKYDVGKAEFKGHCPHCNRDVTFKVQDYFDKSEGSVYLHCWNPHYMDIQHDPLSGRSIYYYHLQGDYKRRLARGDEILISNWPIEMLKAVANNELFRFADDFVYHVKDIENPGLRTFGWGVPRSLLLQDMAYRNAAAGKSVEELLLEYTVPFRVISPANTETPASPGGAADPINTIDMVDYKAQLTQILGEHIRDPGAICASPFPLQYQILGGEAKQFFPQEMLQYFEDNFLNAAMIPTEWYRMTMQAQNAPANLRLFESTWEDLPSDTDKLLGWISQKLRIYLGWEAFKAKLVQPKILDDIQNQNARVQLMAGGSISQSTGLAAVGLNYKTEQRNIADEEKFKAELSAKVQKELETQAMGDQFAMAPPPPQGQDPSMGGGGMGMPPGGGAPMPPGGGGGAAVGAMTGDFMGAVPDANAPVSPNDLMSQGQQIAQQLMGISEEQRHQPLNQLQQKNPVMHDVVVQAMKQMRGSSAGGRGGGGAPPM